MKIKQQVIAEQPTKIKTINYRKYIIPALMVAATLLLFIFSKSTASFTLPASNQVLYAQYYEPYPLSFSTRSENNNQAFLAAGSAYEQQKYSKALPLLEDVLKSNPNLNSRFKLALGICQMEEGAFINALQIFESITQNKNGLYHEHALWYSALIYLQLNEQEQSKKILQSILNDKNNYFYNKANKLLNRIW